MKKINKLIVLIDFNLLIFMLLILISLRRNLNVKRKSRRITLAQIQSHWKGKHLFEVRFGKNAGSKPDSGEQERDKFKPAKRAIEKISESLQTTKNRGLKQGEWSPRPSEQNHWTLEATRVQIKPGRKV